MVCIAACKNDSSTTSAEAGDTAEPAEVKYPLTPFTASQQFPDAAIEEMSYKDGVFDFQIGGDSYSLGEQTPDAGAKMCANSGKGQHIHLIVDKEPYAAKYVSNFEYSVPDGNHNILAFLSRSYHESIKQPKAAKAIRASIKDNSFTRVDPIDDPVLFYSRPKGTYVGDDTKKIMLDFYPVNVNLGKDHLIMVQINGETSYLDKWQPYYIEGLPYGQNSVGVAIVHAHDSAVVENSQTSVLRQIILKRDPAEE